MTAAAMMTTVIQVRLLSDSSALEGRTGAVVSGVEVGVTAIVDGSVGVGVGIAEGSVVVAGAFTVNSINISPTVTR